MRHIIDRMMCYLLPRGLWFSFLFNLFGGTKKMDFYFFLWERESIFFNSRKRWTTYNESSGSEYFEVQIFSLYLLLPHFLLERDYHTYNYINAEYKNIKYYWFIWNNIVLFDSLQKCSEKNFSVEILFSNV